MAVFLPGVNFRAPARVAKRFLALGRKVPSRVIFLEQFVFEEISFSKTNIISKVRRDSLSLSLRFYKTAEFYITFSTNVLFYVSHKVTKIL